MGADPTIRPRPAGESLVAVRLGMVIPNRLGHPVADDAGRLRSHRGLNEKRRAKVPPREVELSRSPRALPGPNGDSHESHNHERASNAEPHGCPPSR